MRVLNIVFSTLLLVFSALSCKKNTGAPNFHYDYFPLQKGKYLTYYVRQVFIDQNTGVNDTNLYYLKAVIGDTITDNQGRVARRYERYVRDSLSQPWVLKDIWTTIISQGRAELVEENQRIIKLVFPPDKYKEWNGNTYNMFDPLIYSYARIHKPATFNGFSFDSTLTVEQENFQSLIDYRRKFECYAKGIGMYYKYYKDFRIYNADSTNVEKGSEINMRLIDYGFE